MVSLSKGVHYYYELIHSESSTQVDVTMRAYLKESSYNYNQTSENRGSFCPYSSCNGDIAILSYHRSTPRLHVVTTVILRRSGCTRKAKHLFDLTGWSWNSDRDFDWLDWSRKSHQRTIYFVHYMLSSRILLWLWGILFLVTWSANRWPFICYR